MFEPFQQKAPRWDRRQALPSVREDFSKAPPPEKRETVPQRHILALGDAMADWLAYGLEDAYSEQPDLGVIRKHKTVSGLIRYQPKGEPADWAAAAKNILATENPDVIVVMLGLDDRTSMHEPAAEKADSKSAPDKQKVDKKADKKDATANRTASRRMPNCPAKPPAPSRRSSRPRKVRAPRTAFTNFESSAGSNSIIKRSRR